MESSLHLKNNTHSENLLDYLTYFQSKALFVDATVICEGKKYLIHQAVLASCSNYFRNIFENTQCCSHPIVILEDIEQKNFEILLNYMYTGKAKVSKRHFWSLIKVCSFLQIKGLEPSLNNSFSVPDCNKSDIQKIPFDLHFCEINNQLESNEVLSEGNQINFVSLGLKILPVCEHSPSELETVTDCDFKDDFIFDSEDTFIHNEYNEPFLPENGNIIVDTSNASEIEKIQSITHASPNIEKNCLNPVAIQPYNEPFLPENGNIIVDTNNASEIEKIQSITHASPNIEKTCLNPVAIQPPERLQRNKVKTKKLVVLVERMSDTKLLSLSHGSFKRKLNFQSSGNLKKQKLRLDSYKIQENSARKLNFESNRKLKKQKLLLNLYKNQENDAITFAYESDFPSSIVQLELMDMKGDADLKYETEIDEDLIECSSSNQVTGKLESDLNSVPLDADMLATSENIEQICNKEENLLDISSIPESSVTVINQTVLSVPSSRSKPDVSSSICKGVTKTVVYESSKALFHDSLMLDTTSAFESAPKTFSQATTASAATSQQFQLASESGTQSEKCCRQPGPHPTVPKLRLLGKSEAALSMPAESKLQPTIRLILDPSCTDILPSSKHSLKVSDKMSSKLAKFSKSGLTDIPSSVKVLDDFSKHPNSTQEYIRPKRPCPYCVSSGRVPYEFSKLTLHLKRRHKRESEVLKAVGEQDPTLRNEAFNLLKKQGIKEANAIMFGKYGKTASLKRERNQGTQELKMCQLCDGFFSKKTISVHVKNCTLKCSLRDYSAKVIPLKLDYVFQSEIPDLYDLDVLGTLNCDEVGNYIRESYLLRSVGKSLYNAKYSKSNKEKGNASSVRQNLRIIANLFLNFRKKMSELVKVDPLSISFEEMFQRQTRYLDGNQSLNLSVLEYVVTDLSENGSNARAKIYWTLTKVAYILKGIYSSNRRDDLANELTYFKDALKSDGTSGLFSDAIHAAHYNRETKLRKPGNLPTTNHIIVIRDYVCKELQKLEDPIRFQDLNYVFLRQVLLTRLAFLNGRRGGQASRLTIKQYKEAKGNQWVNEEFRKIIKKPEEISLLEKFKLAYLFGKGKSIVPLLIPYDCLNALDVLCVEEFRLASGVNINNEFVFAASKKRKYNVTGISDISCIIAKVGLEKAVSATQMRYFISTKYGYDHASIEDLYYFSKHFGHDKSINENIYQCPMPIQEIIRVGGVLDTIDEKLGNIIQKKSTLGQQNLKETPLTLVSDSDDVENSDLEVHPTFPQADDFAKRASPKEPIRREKSSLIEEIKISPS